MTDLELLIKEVVEEARTPRSLVSTVKKSPDMISEVNKKTSFLDEYNSSIVERLYCLVKGITSPVKCKYCDKKAKFNELFSTGYKETCCAKECRFTYA